MAQQSFNNNGPVDFDRSNMGTGPYTSNTNSGNGKMHSGTGNMDSIAWPSMLHLVAVIFFFVCVCSCVCVLLLTLHFFFCM